MKYRILLVDDDSENIFANQALLQNAGYDVMTVDSGEEAIKSVKRAKKDFALILMDYHMPSMSGTEAIRLIKTVKPDQQILTFSMDDTAPVVRENFLSGGSDFLDKNSDNETLLSTVANYCAKYELLYRKVAQDEIEICEQTQFIRQTGMIGRSEKLFNLCKDIRKVAPTTATVMILGESGTGKELVARALHDLSGRTKDKFVAINIAAESQNLLDSSLFGHKKVRLQEPLTIKSANLSKHMVALYFSTKSEICLLTYKLSCFVYYKRSKSYLSDQIHRNQ